MTNPAAAVRRRVLRRRTVACAFALLLSAIAPAGAAPAPQRAAAGPLRGVTTITWSGAAGIRLQVPKRVTVPEKAYRLTVRGARYAFVRMFPESELRKCRSRQLCGLSLVDWIGDIAETSRHGARPPPYDPAADHFIFLSDPPVLDAEPLHLYLFTDGTATLEITARGLRGRAAYRAAGRVAGRAVRLPTRCPATPCDRVNGPRGGVAYGGVQHDVGSLGFVHAIAYSARESVFTGGHGHSQATVTRPCAYPNEFDRRASRDPADHPFGCDPVPQHPDAPGDWVAGAGNFVSEGLGRVVWFGDTHASGPTYIGFQAGAYNPYPETIDRALIRYGGYGVWFRYGIA